MHAKKRGLLVFNLAMNLLVVISIISTGLETIPGNSAALQHFFRIEEIVIVLIFTAEYLWRLATAHKKLHFIFSFYGVIDLVSILPFYLSFGVDLRGLRAFRLIRLFRLFKLARYSKAGDRLLSAVKSAMPEIVMFLSVAMIVVYVCGLGMFYLEHDAQPAKFRSVFDGVWWAVCTLTTVGYGDLYPITWAGRAFTFILLITGLGIVAIPTGLIAAALTRIKISSEQKPYRLAVRRENRHRPSRIKPKT